mmetsp:Transcript_83168/g.269260  ORF Transcript_83168/g.269260 Transcript_83168/m.269260 type:complete len:255 (+) Transcript_83168:530-1294(+)
MSLIDPSIHLLNFGLPFCVTELLEQLQRPLRLGTCILKETTLKRGLRPQQQCFCTTPVLPGLPECLRRSLELTFRLAARAKLHQGTSMNHSGVSEASVVVPAPPFCLVECPLGAAEHVQPRVVASMRATGLTNLKLRNRLDHEHIDLIDWILEFSPKLQCLLRMAQRLDMLFGAVADHSQLAVGNCQCPVVAALLSQPSSFLRHLTRSFVVTRYKQGLDEHSPCRSCAACINCLFQQIRRLLCRRYGFLEPSIK